MAKAAQKAKGGKRPTVHDVAAEAGVSAMTVSRVLNGSPGAGPEVRKRVEKAVAKLGYRRNENARSLRRGERTGLVGVIVTNIENPYYAQLLLGVEEVMDRVGTRLLVGMSHADERREARLVADFVSRQVDALIVVPGGGDASHLRQAELRGTPLVFASRSTDQVVADSVLIDDFGGSLRGVDSLIEAGHRRIAFLGNAKTVTTAQRRYQGYEAAHRERGVAVDRDLVRRACADPESSRTALEELLALEDPPTAVFAANNQVTVGVLDPLLKASRTGVDVALVCVDDFPLSSLVPLPVLIVEHDPRAVGRTAAQRVFQRLEDSDAELPALTLTLPTSLRWAGEAREHPHP